jgi:hypothetical protein
MRVSIPCWLSLIMQLTNFFKRKFSVGARSQESGARRRFAFNKAEVIKSF